MAHKIEDFGEKIGGARKDLWRTRGIILDDFEDINDKEMEMYMKKEYIWVEPDYTQLGKIPEVAYFIRLVREKLPANLKSVYSGNNFREQAKMYVQEIRDIKDFCESDSLKSISDIENFYDNMGKACEYIDDSDEYVRRYTRKAKYSYVYSSKFRSGVMLSRPELIRLISECRVQQFPEKFRGDLKGVNVRKSLNDKWIIVKGIYSKVVRDEFDSEEEAYEYVHSKLLDVLDDKKKSTSTVRKGTIKVVRPQLSHIQRTGGNIRKGNDCTPEVLLDNLGFRAGEFGNWNNDNDRQACLNYAFDAFCDLAYVLDIPLKKISL